MPRLSKNQVNVELDAIQALIEQHPNGLSRERIGELISEFEGRSLPERTLSRRLKDLVTKRRIVIAGAGRAITYRPSPDRLAKMPPAPAAPDSDYVPLSAGGADVRSLVRRPFSQRLPVGYDANFLERYTPGQTWYLSTDQREILHKLGRTPDAAQPAGTYAREIYNRLLIDLAWASSHLEGNTYSRLDTQNLLEFGQRAGDKDAAEAQMVLNHKTAIAMLVDQADYLGFNRFTFSNLHAALSDGLLPDPANEGRLRTQVVDIGGTVYTPLSIPQRIEEMFTRLLAAVAAIPDPFEQAFFIMVHVPYLQPFIDVNKRTSRLAANLSLIKANVCPLSFVDVPTKAYIEGTIAVYELRRVDLLRDVFLWAYERSCQRYRVVRDSVVPPDPLRLRYRDQLSGVVRETVLSQRAPNMEALRSWAVTHEIPDHDVVPFAERALSALLDLHEGVLVRYGLRSAEFQAWKGLFSNVDSLR